MASAPVAVLAGEAGVDSLRDAKLGIGVAFADMGDFDSDWGLRAQLHLRDNWLLSAGWNNVDATVIAPTGPMTVDGSLWQLDLSYIWWSNNPFSDKGKEEMAPGPNWYAGLGLGVRDLAADWTVATITTSAKKIQGAGHIVGGVHWGRFFADLRYETGGNFFGYDADGLELSVGAVWPTHEPR
jgi:hypothetical protein